MADSKKIIVGAATVLISNKSSDTGLVISGTGAIALPKDRNTSVGATKDWRDVGYTQEGVELSYEPDFGEVEVDQLMDAARLFKQSMRVTANTTFAEATLENLVVAWGQREESRTGTFGTGEEVLAIEAGGLGDAPIERAVAFVGPAPRGDNGARERVYFVTRAIQTEATSHALRKTENTGIPTSFRLLPDGSKPYAPYGSITDRAKSDLSNVA